MSKIFTVFTFCLFASVSLLAQKSQEFYEIKIYHLKTDAQEKILDSYLEHALIPALHRLGFANIGVFKPIDADTMRKLYVLIPYQSLNDVTETQEQLVKDKIYLQAGKEYIETPHSSPAFTRLETIHLKAFSHHPKLKLPKLKGSRNERIYELRSYESHTEKIFKNKVHMFNEGGEVVLFDRLGFNAVFYGEVLAGSHMPNLMYMTTFENKAERDAHWKSFGDDAEWKKLSSMPEYQKNVSHIDIFFLRPTAYSDY